MNFQKLWHQVAERFQREELISVRLSGPVDKHQQQQQCTLRPIRLKERLQLQWTWQDREKQQTHENLTWEESSGRIPELLGKDFQNAFIKLTEEAWQVRAVTGREWSVRRHQVRTPEKPQAIDHNQQKQYLFPEGTPIPFLVELGVMTPAGKVRRSRQRKFRQINRFAEFIAELKERFPTDRPVRIVDYGCGKSYLTFAVRELLVKQLGLSVKIQAFDANAGVIETCERTREKLEIEDIRFEVATIQEVQLEDPIDLAIWLHACDTATDDALAKSIASKAAMILAVPCCQHELHHQLESEPLQPLLKHGILRERLAAMTTDALRAQFLEACGYKTQVIEFIDLEHTAKNILIRAFRREQNPQQQREAYEEFRRLKKSIGDPRFHLENVCQLPVQVGGS